MNIVKYPNEILRQVAETINDSDIEVKEKLKEMKKWIEDDSNNALGLALPQVGISKRGFVAYIGKKAIIAINPEITKYGEILVDSEEGCLSIEGKYDTSIKRHRKIFVKYRDENNKLRKEKLSELDAIVFQHELDHLNGKLFIDYFKKQFTSGRIHDII